MTADPIALCGCDEATICARCDTPICTVHADDEYVDCEEGDHCRECEDSCRACAYWRHYAREEQRYDGLKDEGVISW